jgi:hypothetical protein
MKATKQILLYGNSVILEAIGISLSRYSQFEVTKLTHPLQETQKLDAANVDIMLFDLETTHPEAVLSLLEINPTLQLIGISPDVNLVKIWSGRELRELSMQDLLEVIKSAVDDLPSDSGGEGNFPYRTVEKKQGQG